MKFVGSPDLAGQVEVETHTEEGTTDAATGSAELPTTGALATTIVVGDAVVGKQVNVGSLTCEAEIHTEKGTTVAPSSTKRHNRYSKTQIDTEVHNTDSHLSGFCLGNSSDQKMRCRSTQKKSVMSSVEPSTCLTVSVSRPSVRVTRGAIAKSLLSNNRFTSQTNL